MTFFDRIKETSTSTGTGTFTLSGAAVGYKAFTNGTCKYCIVNSTETEWEVGEGTVTSGVLTRTTIEASSNSGSAVNFSAGTKYVFNTVSAAYVNSLVPYTGATSNVNLGTHGITSDYLQLSTTPTAAGAVGRMIWNDTDGTLDIGMKGGNVTLQVGQEQLIRVVNKTGATLTEAAYQAVYISGAQGQRPKVALAQGNTDETSAPTIGLVTETIANNQEGYITTSGIVRGINTTGSLQGETWSDGDLIYLSPTVAGGVTNVKPTAPNHTVVIGYVIYAHANQGKIFVKVDNGYELGELHDIYAPSPTNKQSIYWNSTNSRYELNTIAGILGYTPADDSLVMHLAGTETATGVKTFSIGLKTTTGDNFLNTSSGNLLVGHSSTPGTNTYKLNVNGGGYFAGDITAISSATSIILKGTTTNVGTKGIYFYNNNLSGWVRSVPSGGSDIGNLELGAFGSNFMTASGTVGGPTKASMLVPLEGSEFMGNSVNSGTHYYSFNNAEKAVRIVSTRLGGYGRGDFKILIRTANISTDATDSDAAIYVPGSNRNVSINNGASDMGYALGVNGTFKATGVLQLSSYTTTSSVPGTVAGLLGFDSSGNIITTSASGGISGSGTAGQVTYWSGSSAVTGSATFTYTPTTALLVNNSVTASSAIARGINFTPTLTAAANNDVLVGLDINPTFTNGAFTGVINYAGRFSERVFISKIENSTFDGIAIKNISSGNNATTVIRAYDNSTGFCEFGLGGTGHNSLSNIGYFYTNKSILDFYANAGQKLRIFGSTGNVTIQNGGTFTDAGYRLDVNGTGATAGALRVTGGVTVLQGSGNTGSTRSLIVLNSSAGEMFVVTNNGTGTFNGQINTSGINSSGQYGTLLLNGGANGTTNAILITAQGASSLTTSINLVTISRTYDPTSGSGVYNNLVIQPTINQTGGANGITRGLYVNPTLTAAADFRAIETTNGKIVFGNLPTSSAGLPTGALWNNSGVINIV